MTQPPLLRDVRAPLFLKELSIWLVWCYEENKTGKKPLKVPHYATNGKRRHGTQGSPEDVAQLVTFDVAKEFAIDHDFTGVGIAFSDTLGITGIDFDACVTDEGILLPHIEQSLSGLYVEYSPSGTGVHAFVIGNYGNNKDTAKDGFYGIELFNTKGFLTFTGHTTELCQLTDCEDAIGRPNEELVALMAERFSAPAPVQLALGHIPSVQDKPEISDELVQHALSHISPDCGYHTWLQVGMALHHQSEDNFVLWDSWSANSPKYASEEHNRSKWDSFGKGASAQITIRTLIRLANGHGADISLNGERVSEDDFEIIFKEGEEPRNFFNIRSAQEFMQITATPTWLIKGFLPKATLGVLYGESGSGKSFVALDICASIGRQIPWNGLRPAKTRCRVLYVVAEGVNGFTHRLSAYCHQAGIRADDLSVDIISDVTPNLMDPISVNHLINDIETKGPYDLIVMDTFAQVTPGANENSGEDMGRALGYCKKIANCANAMVLLIHHSGKDASKGARGWSGVHAASDVVFEVSRFEEERRIRVTKSKDGLDDVDFGFSLIPVVLGIDEDGDDLSSCVVDYHPFVKPVTVPALKNNQRVVYTVLSEITEGSWVSVNHVIELCLERLPKEDGVKDGRKYNVRRTINSAIGEFIDQNDNGEIQLKRR